MSVNTMQQGPAPEPQEQIGWCEYQKCGQPAYYRIDFNCDYMKVDVCDAHHNTVLALFGLPDCEGDE